MGFRTIGYKLWSCLSMGEEMWGESVSLPKSEEAIEIVELDEIHSYVQKKNYCWSWIAVDRFEQSFVDFVCGKRNTQTFKKLWDRLKDMNINGFCSDYWKSYSELIPDKKHCESKKETFTVEGYNSRIRYYLARFKRKTKSYSKTQHMLEKSLKLLFLN